jgi:hypothetical protein
MERTSILIGLGLGICTFGVAWPTVRHFTGLAHENGLALAIAVVVGLLVGVGYIALESSLFDIRRRRHHD